MALIFVAEPLDLGDEHDIIRWAEQMDDAVHFYGRDYEHSGVSRRRGRRYVRVKVTIRPYDQSDADDLADVFFHSVRQAALSDYTVAQVKAWLPERPAPAIMHHRASDGRMVLVAVNKRDRVVGYIDLEASGHIDHLFCAPEAVGHGVASQLYDATEAAAHQQGINRLFAEASEPGRRLFERRGFQILERQELIRHGVVIHDYRMEKVLARSDHGGDIGPADRSV